MNDGINSRSEPAENKERNNTLAVLVDLPESELATVDPGVARAIGALREGRVILHPGGGGCYGTFEIPSG